MLLYKFIRNTPYHYALSLYFLTRGLKNIKQASNISILYSSLPSISLIFFIKESILKVILDILKLKDENFPLCYTVSSKGYSLSS